MSLIFNLVVHSRIFVQKILAAVHIPIPHNALLARLQSVPLVRDAALKRRGGPSALRFFSNFNTALTPTKKRANYLESFRIPRLSWSRNVLRSLTVSRVAIYFFKAETLLFRTQHFDIHHPAPLVFQSSYPSHV